jgi:hypothetical protein
MNIIYYFCTSFSTSSLLFLSKHQALSLYYNHYQYHYYSLGCDTMCVSMYVHKNAIFRVVKVAMHVIQQIG